MTTEKIKLKVPENRELPDEVAIGNFTIRLVPGTEVEITSARVAEWLKSEYGLKTTKSKDSKEVKHG
ncbi:hypothetical protein WAI99_22315, partial [Acinetobacter baumannii]